MRQPLALCFFLSISLPLFAAEKPNILWITSEDHGPHMGCYGDTYATTPNVDALAARGMLFNRCWSNAPVCASARSTLILGIHSNSSGGEHMRSQVPLPKDVKMYPQLLQEAGYYCTNNSKTDYNFPLSDQVWNESSNKAHWKNRPEGTPFFAIFNSTASHESQLRKRPHKAVHDPAKVRVPAYHPDTPEVRQDWAQYYDTVTAADAVAGQHLAEMEGAGLAEDTIVFYYADHGSGMPRNKRWPSNTGLHVPLIVYFPEKWKHLAPEEYGQGTKSDRLVSFVDFPPTLLSLAGVEPPDWMQGSAFAGEFEGDDPSYLFGFRGRMDERYDVVRSVTDGRYVYVRNFMPHLSQGQHVSYQFETPTTVVWRKLFDQGKLEPNQQIFWREPKAPEELYDLQADPDEVRNLIESANHQNIVQEMRQALHQHQLEILDVGLLPEGEMHSRSDGKSPYDMARTPGAFPIEIVLETAELASSMSAEHTPVLVERLNHADAAVRYWAALGLRMRDATAVASAVDALNQALKDDNSQVRIAAAWALAKHGPESTRDAALETLLKQADWSQSDVFSCVASLNAIDHLGDLAKPILPQVLELPVEGKSPNSRSNGYVKRLIDTLKNR